MKGRVCVATSEARVYYSLVSRLRRAGLPFASLVPGGRRPDCDVVLTTGAEAGSFGPAAVPAELLDEDPFVFKGQILSRMDGGRETLLMGVDPGTRIGMATYYGDDSLEFCTLDSAEDLCAKAAGFAKVRARRFIVKIGNGSPAMAAALARSVSGMVPGAAVEIVDEAGTSVRGVKMRGVQGDQLAAARIAFRKGVPFSLPPRSPASGSPASPG